MARRTVPAGPAIIEQYRRAVLAMAAAAHRFPH